MIFSKMCKNEKYYAIVTEDLKIKYSLDIDLAYDFKNSGVMRYLLDMGHTGITIEDEKKLIKKIKRSDSI